MHVLFYEMEGVLTRERRLIRLNPQHLWPCTSSLDLYSLLLRMPINPSTSFLALGDGEGTRRMKKKVVVRVVDIHRMNTHHAYVVHYGLDWVLYLLVVLVPRMGVRIARQIPCVQNQFVWLHVCIHILTEHKC